MSKVHPQTHLCSSPPSSSSSSEREVFTIWMKSLILGGKGCTVYDSKGEIVYRVDNYNSKGCKKVFLMDSPGKLLCTILTKKFNLWASWEGHRAGDSCPWFRIRKPWRVSRNPWRSSDCKVVVSSSMEDRTWRLRSCEKPGGDVWCSIEDINGGLIAEVKRKQSAQGVILGNDVLTLTVEPHVDSCLVMGLVVSYGLISSTI